MIGIDARVDDRDDAAAGPRGGVARGQANRRCRRLVDVTRPHLMVEVAHVLRAGEAVQDRYRRSVQARSFEFRRRERCVRLDVEDRGIRGDGCKAGIPTAGRGVQKRRRPGDEEQILPLDLPDDRESVPGRNFPSDSRRHAQEQLPTWLRQSRLRAKVACRTRQQRDSENPREPTQR